MNKALAALMGSLLVGIVSVVVAPTSSAVAQTADLQRFEKAQAKRTFTVYAPTETFGLPLTDFQSVPCGGGADDALTFSYGSQSSRESRWISPVEYPGRPCLDGPDGIARVPVATFTIEGAKVRVMGACPDLRPICKKSTRALAKRQGYTTVTLPGSAARPTPTYIEIYSQQISIAEIRAFVHGLTPAT